jgi:hypothetical protein
VGERFHNDLAAHGKGSTMTRISRLSLSILLKSSVFLWPPFILPASTTVIQAFFSFSKKFFCHYRFIVTAEKNKNCFPASGHSSAPKRMFPGFSSYPISW